MTPHFPNRRSSDLCPSARGKKPGLGRPPLVCGPAGAGPSSARLIDRLSRPHQAASHHLKEVIMAQIGSFNRGENGVYTGEIRTLPLSVKPSIPPSERDNEKDPDTRCTPSGVACGQAGTQAARETGQGDHGGYRTR